MIIPMFIMAFMGLFSTMNSQENQTFKAISPNMSEISVIQNSGQFSLHKAVLANDLRSVKKILKTGSVNVNKLDHNNKTALDYAVEYGHSKIVKILFKNNGKVTSLDNAEYAKKFIVKPFKLLFFIAFPLLVITSIVFFPHCLLALVTVTPAAVGPCLIGTVVGAAGWISRSHRNLLLV